MDVGSAASCGSIGLTPRQKDLVWKAPQGVIAELDDAGRHGGALGIRTVRSLPCQPGACQ